MIPPAPDRVRTVAAFDFDGTVSRRDTLIPFVARVAGLRRSTAASLGAGWSSVRGRLVWRDRDAVKAEMIRRLLAGRSSRELQRAGGEYATRLIDSGLRPDVVEQVHRHVAAGHETVFVSASLVYYLEPIARHLGMAATIGVQPEEIDGRLTGEMTDANVRAAHKAVMLRRWLNVAPDAPLSGVELWAYGNSSGDHELLAMADHALWLGKPNRRPPDAIQFTPGVAF